MNANAEDIELIERAFASEVSRDISVEGLRRVFAVLSRSLNRPLPSIGALHERLPIYAHRDDVTVDVMVPRGAGPHPVLLYIHGGAWVAGSAATHRQLTCRFAQAGYLVVSLDYRLAPEHPFPAAYEDCVQALHWTARWAHRFGGDAARLAVGGDSAGGNLTAALASTLRYRPGAPGISAVLLIYGVFDFTEVGGALVAPVLHEAYLGRGAARALLADPRVSPINLARRLPPSYVIVGNRDPLKKDSESICAELSAAGIEHELEVVPDMPHGFMQMEFLGTARPAVKRMVEFLSNHTAPSLAARARQRLYLTLAALGSRRTAPVPDGSNSPVANGRAVVGR